MQKTKTHQILVRGVPKRSKDTIKRLARTRRQSVNSYLLDRIEWIVKNEFKANEVL